MTTTTLNLEDLAHASLDDARSAFVAWVAENSSTLDEFRGLHGDMDETFAKLSELQRILYDAGWIRLGWPPELGGLGGTLALRGMVSEELAAAGYPPPFSFATQEVLGPAVARYATPELAAEVLPRLLRGEEKWCQGFSEPGAGSDLASLRVRATDEGEHWRVSGEKIWTSWAKFADRCFLLARTGAPESAHRGITAMLLDMDTPGIEVRPLPSIAGDDEFCSLYFDDVLVPKSRTLGDVNGGWAVAMYVLANERGAAAWQRQAWMNWRLGTLIDEAPDLAPVTAGEAYELIYGLRLLSRRTLRTLDRGESPGVNPSFDKILMSTAEKFLFDAAVEAMPERLLLDADPKSEGWRGEYMYSRASSIYGGTAEIQRNIIADRVLGLPKG
jgi:alkylation response protein AidB-like acyl-CoA dehydrogenase